MNYLKKKLKGHKKGHDADDDYDNYIPAVPPHPSTLANQEGSAPTTIVLGDTQEPNGITYELEKLKELEKLEKEREIKEREEREKASLATKKDKEEWQFFQQLTQRVQATVSQTQTALDKIKDTSAVEEIVNKPEIDYYEEEIAECIKPPGAWEAFEGSQLVADLDVPPAKEEKEITKLPDLPPPEKTQVESDNFKNLLDDFGFGEPPSLDPSEAVVYDPSECEYLDDPFDTSFVDISQVSNRAAAESILSGKSGVIINCCSDFGFEKSDGPDPFDTSYIENTISGKTTSVVKPDSLDIVPPANTPVPLSTGHSPAQFPDENSRCFKPSQLSRHSSRESIMSNPFLADLDPNDYYTPYASGATTPYSGTATPTKRRNSTNPFEMSPEAEVAAYPISPVASAIANMTQDFCNAISSTTLEGSAAEGSEVPFDPFATIVDDETPKRQSITDAKPTSLISPDITRDPFEGVESHDETSANFLATSSGAEFLSDVSDTEEASKEQEVESTERRRSSAFQMELLARDKDEPQPKFEPLPASIVSRKPFLPIDETEANKTDQLCDFFDNSGELVQTGDLIGETNYFDPFTTVYDRDDKSPTPPVQNEPNFENLVSTASRKLSTQDSISDVGNPNKDATGIINDAFDEAALEEENIDRPSFAVDNTLSAFEDLGTENDISAKDDVDNDGIASAEMENQEAVTATSDTNALNETSLAATAFDLGPSDSGLGICGADNDATDSGRDPFDTSEYSFEPVQDALAYTDTASFDAFASKFDSASGGKEAQYDPFASPMKKRTDVEESGGFDIFDPFAKPAAKTPKNTPARIQKETSKDSFDDDDEEDNFKVVIKAKMKDTVDKSSDLAIPILLPPPPKTPTKSPLNELSLMPDENEVDEFEQFFGGGKLSEAAQAVQPAGGEPEWPTAFGEAATKRTDSTESPQTPLFDEDTSVPLEDFPTPYEGDGWEMMLRHPNKKKLTANRFWKKIYVRFSENCVIQLFNKKEDNDPFQELPLQPTYSLSEISAQQYDQYGKIFTVKLQYIFYRERVGVRPGQIAKVMQGQIMSVGQIAKLGMPLEHAPQVSELIKLGSQNYTDMKQLTQVVEEALFRMTIHRDRALQYKTEEIQMAVQDELYVEQNKMGTIFKQLARVRLFFLSFLNGMPTIEIGINDLTRQGKEVVGRHDIIPVVTEEWIRVENYDFHCTVQPEEFEATRIIKLIPPDACYFELMRFRIRPPRNRELPLQVNANLNITKSKIELKCEVLVPGCISRKHGQIPCEDIQIRFDIPECWIYFFRVEKHFRYGALKSAARRPGKIKGIERLLGTAQNQEPQLIEVSAGSAKYEHVFHSIVWRIPRLPKEGQGAYTQQLFLLRLPLTSFDQIPETFYEYVHVEFKMPSTTVSHTTLRSISVSNENPPEKFVRYIAKYEYKVEMNISQDDHTEAEYVAAVTSSLPPPSTEITNTEVRKAEDSDESD